MYCTFIVQPIECVSLIVHTRSIQIDSADERLNEHRVSTNATHRRHNVDADSGHGPAPSKLLYRHVTQHVSTLLSLFSVTLLSSPLVDLMLLRKTQV